MSPRQGNPRGPLFRLAIAGVVALLAFFAFAILPRLRIETNLLALLPSTAETRVQLGAVTRFADRSSREIVFLVGTADRDRLRDTGMVFAQELTDSDAFARVEYTVDDRYMRAAREERVMRGALLNSRHREQLRSGDLAALERDALRAAYTPLGFARPFGVVDDPLGIASGAFAEQLPGAGHARVEGDILVVHGEDKHWALVRATTAGDPYRTETQGQVTDAIAAARAAAADISADASFAASGVVLHAAAAASKAQKEIATFGTIDLLAIVALIMLVFWMIRPLVFTLVTLGIATTAAIAACQLVFGNVHILTLTFGTSLIGVSVDYSLHYFVNRMRDGDAHPHNIVPALMLGCTTAVAGYLTLLFAPIPGLRQIALFSAVGLVVACACVILIYPGLDRAEMKRGVPAWVGRFAALRVEELLPRAAWWVAVPLAVAACAWGISRLDAHDDIRSLQRPPPDLVASERRVRDLLGVGFDTRFVLVTADSPEQVLQRLESLAPVLERLKSEGRIRGALSPSPGLVSLERQRADRELLARVVYGEGGALERVMGRLGFTPEAIYARRAEFAAGAAQPLTPEAWLASPLSAPVRHLWLGRLDDQHAAVVLLDGNQAPEVIQAAVNLLPGVRYVDQVADISAVLGEYRRIASWVMLVVIAVMIACLLAFYRSGAALRTALPAAAGIAVTLATLGWLQEPINLFHVLSLLLVLGLGVDYAIILREGRSHQAVLAVTLSMTTTFISFGLLGFSSVPFVRSIGITVALGIAFTFLIAIASKPRPASAPLPLPRADAEPVR